MALVRCKECGMPRGRTRNYVKHVLPIGHPNSAIICGTRACRIPGFIWLEEKESKAYDKGERIFGLQTATTKVRAQ